MGIHRLHSVFRWLSASEVGLVEHNVDDDAKQPYSVTIEQVQDEISPSPELHAAQTVGDCVAQGGASTINGIVEEGQNSKINVIIQLLFHIRAFREVVNNSEANSTDQQHGTATRALQQIFHDLETSSEPVSLGDLTPLIGWDDRILHKSSLLSHDFFSVLHELETRLGSSHIRDTIHHLFYITEKTYLHSYTPLFRCSSRIESSTSLLLNTRKHSSLHESIKKFIAPNPIYENEKLESACTRTIEHLPPVWMIDLRRFQYRHPTDSMVVFRHRYEFPETIDAAAYLSNFADYSESWQYRLHGVVVFEKSMSEQGHFYLYLKPSPARELWYKIDGDLVANVSSTEVFEENFGQARPDLSVRMSEWDKVDGRWRYPRMAETLIYVRESRFREVFGPG